ncbi:MAG: TonB C-terminal domain-containing protein [Endomicrobium sp.]|nr:TonB C-terminal domain-containing protein [Endomicrobium sp.]
MHHNKEDFIPLSYQIEVVDKKRFKNYNILFAQNKKNSEFITSKKSKEIVQKKSKIFKKNICEQFFVVKPISNDKKKQDILNLKDIVVTNKEDIVVTNKNDTTNENSSILSYNNYDNNINLGNSEIFMISFEKQNSIPYYYKIQIIRNIEKCCIQIKNYKKLKAVVYFKIHKNGTTSDISIKISSGNIEYDKNVLDVIRRATPFPFLPEYYNEDSLGVFFEFKCNSD